jgi:hypothetical protein
MQESEARRVLGSGGQGQHLDMDFKDDESDDDSEDETEGDEDDFALGSYEEGDADGTEDDNDDNW